MSVSPRAGQRRSWLWVSAGLVVLGTLVWVVGRSSCNRNVEVLHSAVEDGQRSSTADPQGEAHPHSSEAESAAHLRDDVAEDSGRPSLGAEDRYATHIARDLEYREVECEDLIDTDRRSISWRNAEGRDVYPDVRIDELLRGFAKLWVPDSAVEAVVVSGSDAWVVDVSESVCWGTHVGLHLVAVTVHSQAGAPIGGASVSGCGSTGATNADGAVHLRLPRADCPVTARYPGKSWSDDTLVHTWDSEVHLTIEVPGEANWAREDMLDFLKMTELRIEKTDALLDHIDSYLIKMPQDSDAVEFRLSVMQDREVALQMHIATTKMLDGATLEGAVDEAVEYMVEE